MHNPSPPTPDPVETRFAQPAVKFRPAAVLVGLVLGASCVALEATGPKEDVGGALWVGALFVLAGLGLDAALYWMRKRGRA